MKRPTPTVAQKTIAKAVETERTEIQVLIRELQLLHGKERLVVSTLDFLSDIIGNRGRRALRS